MNQHDSFKYSATIRSDDLWIVAALRGIAWQSQRDVNKQIPWGNTKKCDWERDGHQVTFHFTDPEYREDFLREGRRLLPPNWAVLRQSENDRAKPPSKKSRAEKLLDELLV